MRRIFLLLLLAAPIFTIAQDKGIHFEHGIAWEQVLAKAKAEHKYIFIDCFTTWCGPCKYMSKNIFPMEEVGKYFNEKFINVKLQLDTTAGDNAEVKSWYQAGHDIAEKYQVRAYPTYLFLDENGDAVHRSIGSSEAAAFLEKARAASDPDKQYYALLKKYNAGVKDTAFLYKITKAARDVYDMGNAKKAFTEYIATQTDLYSSRNLELIPDFTQSSSDKGFAMMMENPEKIDAVVGKGASASITQHIIMREEIYGKYPPSGKQQPDWNTITASLQQKYPQHAAEILAKGKITWYQGAKDWPNFQQSVVAYMKSYGAKLSPNEMNEYAWTVFENCKDKACITKALEWSKQSFSKDSVPGFMDTYANLLYKLGRNKEAMQWEAKAASLAEEGDKKGYLDVLDKMKKGTKTWTE